MRNARYLLMVLGSFMAGYLTAQYAVPDLGIAFDDTEVPRVDITMDPADLNSILVGDLESNKEYPARFIYTTSYSKDTVEQAGFRLRGNTSRGAGKKSFKVSFNAFVRGQKWEGLEKLNLNGEHNDPSIMRTKLAWDLYRKMGIPAARCNHVALYINEEYRGLYVNVEHIDERFLKKRMRHQEGNLYKCLWPADMRYKGQDPEVYKEEFWGRRAYDLKTNTSQASYADIAHLIDVLNNYAVADLYCALELILDVDGLLRCMAMDVLIGNWDGAFLNKNNFYLYADPVTGRFTFIPFDLDNTLGIDFFDIDWARASVYNWSTLSGESRPLYTSLLKIPEYKDRYTAYLAEAMESTFHPDTISAYLSKKLSLVKAYRGDDTYAALDYGYDLEDFESSVTDGVGAHVPYGITEYVDRRYGHVQNSITSVATVPAVEELSYEKKNDTVVFHIALKENADLQEVILYTKIDDAPEESQTVNLIDGIGSYNLEIADEDELVNYYISMQQGTSAIRHFPFCKDGMIQLISQERFDLVINEFVASNTSGKTDDAGEYEDWIELYNTGGQRLDLSDYFLTDDRDEPSKWRLPQKYLYPAEYAVFWMDKDTEQGPNHGNFKLSKQGEFLGLYKGPFGGYFPVDTMTFSLQETDRSSARMPNGYGGFAITSKITFATNNDNPSAVIELGKKDLVIYPNPVNDILNINFSVPDCKKIRVYSVLGLLLMEENCAMDRVAVSDLRPGTYILEHAINGELQWQKFIKG